VLADITKESLMITQLNLFKNNSKKIGLLNFDNKKTIKRNRNSSEFNGMKAIKEDSKHDFFNCNFLDYDDYDYVLVSITSPDDYYNLIRTGTNKRRHAKIIIGGSGLINTKSILPYFDIANIGRCDGLIDDIIDGYIDNSIIDSKLFNDSTIFNVRQATKKYYFEETIGCKYKCKFCQYTHVRKLCGETYSHGDDLRTYEDNFIDFKCHGPGRYTTAFDGLSESTRMKVSKPIKDELIIDKLQKIILSNFDKTVTIKAFQIIGYPWETIESVINDLQNLKELFKKADPGKGGRVFMMLLFTPFSPEPLTPMELCKANTYIKWMDILEMVGRQLYVSDHLEVMVLPQVYSPLMLLKWVCVNKNVDNNILMQLDKEKKNNEMS